MSLTALAFVLAFVAGCLAAFVRHPVWGLVTYLGIFYANPPSRWWGQGLLLDVRWSLIAAGVALAAVVLHKPKLPSMSLLKNGAFLGFAAFVGWIAVQSFWAKDAEAHSELLSMYLKFMVVIYLFSRSIETEQHLKLAMWAHVLGCFYLGWIAYTSYSGGRFEGFGGPGIGEANAAALQLVTAIVAAGALLLTSSVRVKALLMGLVAVIVNAIVSTISRSGFLAVALAGLVFNLFTPARYRRTVSVLSVLAVVLFALLTNPVYWARIATLKYQGEEVEGVDTGAGRLVIIDAQWRMFQAHPLGCGSMCTTVLSPSYLEEARLSEGARASHNTFMTMLVDHGIPGGVFYGAMLIWIIRNLRVVAGRLRGDQSFLAAALPAVAAALAAITIGDLFAQYPRFEARVWFVSMLMILLHLTSSRSSQGSAA